MFNKKVFKMKTLMCLLISLLMFALATSAMATETAAEEDFTFEDGVITAYLGDGGDVVIPSTINDVAVTEIASWAFAECTSLESVTIPEGVVTINGYAFSQCTSLESATIPASVEEIGGQAFYLCSSLESITVDGENECYSSVDGVLFNEAQTQLMQYPVASEATSYEIPSTVEIIDDWSFTGCSTLKSLTIPSSIETIGYAAFYDCSSLASVTIAEGVITIGGDAFMDCDSLTSIVIPSSVETIGEYVLGWCDLLETITIGSGVETIGEGAFGYCPSLKSITVDTDNQYFSSIDGILFNKDQTTLIQYPLGLESTSYDSLGLESTIYIIPSTVETIGDAAFAEWSSLESVIIPSSVQTIGQDAFADCTSLESVIISEGVTTIYGGAFYNCSSLESIIIPLSVTSVGNYAFTDCTSLTYVYYAGSESDWAEVSIGTDNECLTNATIHYDYVYEDSSSSGDSLSSYDKVYDFVMASESDFTFADGAITAYSGDGGYIIIPDTIGGVAVTEISGSAFYGNENIKGVSLPENLTTIGGYAFGSSTALEVVIPNDNLETIGDSAFMGCSSLEWFVISSKVSYIGDGAFALCPNLSYFYTMSEFGGDKGYFNTVDGILYTADGTELVACPAGLVDECYLDPNINNSVWDDDFSLGLDFEKGEVVTDVVVPSGVTTIREGAFWGCENLETITLSASVDKVGFLTFETCTSLEAFYVASGSNNFVAVDGVLFNADMTALVIYPIDKTDTKYDIPSTVTYIWDSAFCKADNLTSVYIPESVTDMGYYTFAYCPNLEYVEIAANITEIESSVFENCTSLNSITIPNTVTFIDLQAFSGCESLKTIWYMQYEDNGMTWEDVIKTYAGISESVNVYEASVEPLDTMFTAIPYEIALDASVFASHLPEGFSYDDSFVSGVASEAGHFNFITYEVTTASYWDESSLILEETLLCYMYTFEILEYTSENTGLTQTQMEESQTDVGYEVSIAIPDTIYSTDSIVWKSEGAFVEFQNVWFNGVKLILDTDYYAVEGSTKITILSQTVSTYANVGESNIIVAEFKETDTEELKIATQIFDVVEKTSTSNGGGGGSSSSSSTVAEEVAEEVVEITYEVSTDGVASYELSIICEMVDGKAIANLTAEDLADAIEAMLADDESLEFKLVISMDGLADDATSGQMNFDVAVLAMIGDLDNASVVFELGHLGSVELSDATLDEMLATDAETFAIDLVREDETVLELTADGDVMTAIQMKVYLPGLSYGQVVITTVDGDMTLVKKSIMSASDAYAILTSGVISTINNSKEFSDVNPEAYYAADVDVVNSRELFLGMSDTEFAPTENMTRAMIATVLYRLEDAVNEAGTNNFDDVAGDVWYSDSINWVFDAGIVTGYGDDTFGVNDNVTVEQLVTFLYRYAEYLDMNINAKADLSDFADSTTISSWANEQMQWAVAEGIIYGDNGSINPDSAATRGQVACILTRFIGLLVK